MNNSFRGEVIHEVTNEEQKSTVVVDSDVSMRPISQDTRSEEWNTLIQRCTKKPSERPSTSINIAILGNMDVGKTSLTHKYVTPELELRVEEKIKTRGTDTRSMYVTVCGDTTTKIKIWDTAG